MVSKVSMVCVLALSLFGLAGCNHHDDRNESSYSQPTPPTPYPLVEDKAKGYQYAVLQEGSVVTRDIDKWQAVNPEFFAKLSGITVAAPVPDGTPHPGVGYIMPKIDVSTQYPDRKLTTISAGYLVPKELNGWVAVSLDTFEKLAKDFMTSK